MGFYNEFNNSTPILIIGRVGEKCGNVHLCYSKVWVNDNALIFKPLNEKMKLEYIFHSLVIRDLNQLRNKNTQPLITGTLVKNEYVPLPPLYEQQQIVSYLDEKTSLIDTLIQSKQKKIALLKEKRTALINQVVTKGLDPDVEMKDSGVEWIGEIPEDWVTSRLKYVSVIRPSNVDKHVYPEEIPVKLCNYTDVYYNKFITRAIELKDGSCSINEYDKFQIKANDVIITKDSESTDDIGIPAFVKYGLEGVVCGYHLTLLRPKNITGGYLFRFIQSNKTRRYFEINSSGITRYSLGKSTIENLFIPLPPHQEQQQIIEYLDKETSLIDKTVSIEERKIELLKEYKQSLISEVVTGKRKVISDE